MLRDVPRNLTKQDQLNGKRAICASLLLLLTIGIGGIAVAQSTDVSIETLHISWVESADVQQRPTLGLDQAMVGDTLRVSATVKNLGTASAGQFNVDFFFTETISGEHGKIGTQAVIGLESGEQRRPVVTFDSSAFAPGIYIFSAEADPDQVLGESERCNNFAPLGSCADALEQSEERYKLTLLQDGSHISELSLRGDFSICRMGPLDTSLIVDVHNVGTDTISLANLETWGYYRLALDPPADQFEPLRTDSTSGTSTQLQKIFSPIGSGDEGAVFITLDYSIFNRLLQPSSSSAESGDVLGKPTPVQLRITAEPTVGGSAQSLFLPEQFTLGQFYSDVDLWTFPARTHCQCDDYTDVVGVSVEPAVAGGLVFHVVNTAGGDRLHVLKIRDGVERLDPWVAPAGVSLASIVASYDSDTKTYRAYAAASNGKLYAFEGVEKDEGSFLQQVWESGSSSLVSGAAFLALVESDTLLVAGSASGAYVLDTATGEVLRSHPTYVVSTAPAYVSATEMLWVAQDEFVYGIGSSGTACEFDALDLVTTPLLLNGSSTSVFFGTDQGTLYAIDATGVGGTCTSKDAIEPGGLRTIIGMTVISNDEDAVLYMAGDTGVMGRIEYNEGQGFDDYDESQRAYEPTRIAFSPATLDNEDGDDALAVFFVGETRDGRVTRPILQAMEKDLEEYESVSVWGSSVPFVFKPEENDVNPERLLTPIIDAVTFTLLVASSDGYLYAFDLRQFE